MTTPCLLAAVLLSARPAAAAERGAVAVVLNEAEAEGRPELRDIAGALHLRRGAALVGLSQDKTDDPILKGRLLADLERRDLIVAVGDDAAAFAAREMSETPVYFVDVAVLRGDLLSSPSVGGVFAYNVDALLDAVHRLGLGRLGLAYTPGYEPVAEWVRRGAAERGLPLAEARIAGVEEVAPAVRRLLRGARAVWVVGDPVLARGAGFEFLRRNALSRGVAIVAPDAADVRRGALLAFEAPAESLTREALAAIDAAASAPSGKRERLSPAPRQGVVLIDAALAERWRLTVPGGPSWRAVR